MTPRYVLAAVAAAGAAALGAASMNTTSAADIATLRRAAERSAVAAAQSRVEAADAGFERFKAKVYKEPFPDGVYIVNGDTPIATEEELREFYRREIVAEWKHAMFGLPLGNANPALVVDAPGGQRMAWDNITKKNLSYCVSTSFGARHQAVVAAMRAAASAWEQSSDVRFVHLAELDGSCNASTPRVVFDVRPVDVGGQYLARAFFPRTARPQRNVLIDNSSFQLHPGGKLQLTGILRHELGHVLAFRHEQTRPEAGKCFEDKDWQPLTSYDGFSVMHYPQCNGLGDWSLQLTNKDKVGAACLYGAAQGTVMDPGWCAGNY